MFVILAFAIYAVYQRLNGSAPVVSVVQNPPSPIAAEAPKSQPAHAPKTPVKKTSSNTGVYRDGIYTGSSADAYYGNVRVQATIQGGKLANVQFLDYPSDRGTSREINGQAMPYLKQEAIQAQSANVDIVSGATDTSLAFRQSLASALVKAKN